MPQVKVYGLATTINPIKAELSNVIQSCMAEVLQLPIDRKFQRFFPMNPEDYYFANDRTNHYLIIEILMFTGRNTNTKKALIKLLMKQITETFKLSVNDLEITILESLPENWGVRGVTGDEL